MDLLARQALVQGSEVGIVGGDADPEDLVTDVLHTEIAEFADAAAGVKTGRNELAQCRCASLEKTTELVPVEEDRARGVVHRDTSQASPWTFNADVAVVQMPESLRAPLIPGSEQNDQGAASAIAGPRKKRRRRLRLPAPPNTRNATLTHAACYSGPGHSLPAAPSFYGANAPLVWLIS